MKKLQGGVSWIVIVAVVAVVVAAAAFFAGRALAGGGGPETLSEAVAQAQAGDLPCGDVPAAPTPGAAGGADPAAGGAPPMGAGGAGGASFALRAICSQGEADAAGGQGAGRRCPAAASAARGFGQQVKSVDGDKLTLTGPQGDTTVDPRPGHDGLQERRGRRRRPQGRRQRDRHRRPPTGEAATSVLIVPAQN